MAQCKDCIHYEICDEYVSPNESFPEVAGCKCFKTAEDVKLDRAMSLMEKFLLEDQEARYNALMAEHDRELARKIFEEIDQAIAEQYPIYTVKSIIKSLDYVKKKYTESEDKP